MRVVLGVEYDGSEFFGWQWQPNDLRTVQNELQIALSKVANQDVRIQCAGRTDTGVHATAQVVHFDTDVDRNSRAWIYGTNSFLPHDITVKWVKILNQDFHARFSATARTYQYYIYNNPVRPSLMRTAITWQYRPLNHELMHEAAQHLIGEHNFSSFRAIDCQSKTPFRNIERFEVTRHRDMICVEVKANAFLHHMVRNMVGTLMLVGAGKHPPEWVKEVLESQKRSAAGETAPSYGLYLIKVDYPGEFDLPDEAQAPYFLIK